MVAVTMPSPIQDLTITNILIMGITATVVPRFWALATVTGITAAIGAVILLMAGIVAMAVIEEGTETFGTGGLAVFAADSIDKDLPFLIFEPAANRA
jgi:hypothetical protein